MRSLFRFLNVRHPESGLIMKTTILFITTTHCEEFYPLKNFVRLLLCKNNSKNKVKVVDEHRIFKLLLNLILCK